MAVDYIGIMFSTYREEHAPANVRLALTRDSDKSLVAVSEMDRKEIVDSKGVYLKFPRKIFLGKGSYSMALSLVGYAGPKMMTALATETGGNTGNILEINGRRSDISLQWRMVEDMSKSEYISKNWNVIDLEPGIVILENKQVTNGVYFLKDLHPRNDRIDYSGVSVRHPSSSLIEIDYSGKEAGWIVLPMHLHRGWKAYMGDRQIPYDSYLDIMPAIPVQGAGKVLFRYEPASFKIGIILSLTGIIMLTIFGIYSKKLGARRKPE
jgi:hypothetical protein